MSTIEMFVNPITTLLLMGLGGLGGLWWLMTKFRKDAENQVQVEFISETGKSKFSLVPEENHTVTLPTKETDTTRHKLKVKPGPKGEIEGKIWPIKDICFTEVLYPAGLPKIMQTPIKKVIVAEWTLEPISKRTDAKIATPALWFLMMWEKFSKLAVAYSEVVTDLEERLQKALTRSANPTYLYIGIGVAIAASVFTFTTANAVKEQNIILSAQNAEILAQNTQIIEMITASYGVSK